MVSPIKLKDILAYVGQFAPWELAEPWDNVGLMIGNPDQEATGVLIALDPTRQVIEEAILKKANIILTHHPLIFHPLKSINTATPIGQFLKKALAHDIAVVSCHTNLDIISDGVSDALARVLYLHNTRPLTLTGNRPDQGFGKLGNLPKPMQGGAFINFVVQRLQLEAMMIAGPLPETVSTIAVCGGSGSDLAEAALLAGADVYITAELKHSVARWAEDNRLCVIDAGHFATENIIIPSLLARMTAFFSENNNPAPVMASQRQNSPLRFYIAENMPTII
ncbi:MAG: Nif3-like dinuclear metal center hexameric protein [Proteobacteria bacterium]|nr:Nif3-like dinuclear metal center hexameric protein [Pseudomonadota bacterium]MBU4296258.1 Nif3-like dinuclear metal center hexameric protein [Pseudomonadota bacterium]MCG2746384.1 Nif3-like dinuclear metal center hexameric protein [Desulfobulbaceae bacterium]